MIIDVCVDYPVSSKSLLVEVQFPNSSMVIDLHQSITILKLNFDLPISNQIIDLSFCCNDINIVNHPLTITSIVLDDFYQSNGITYRGQPVFDQQFLLFAKQNNRLLDPNITGSNRLDFTGKLVYKFCWPFYKNIFSID